MYSIKYQSKLYSLSYRNIINKNKFKEDKSETQKKNKIDCIRTFGLVFSKKECEVNSKFL